MQRPSKVSIDEVVSESMQLQISEIAAKIEQAVQNGNFREEAELVLNLLELLNSDETSAIYGFDLGETIVRCSEFMDKLSFAQKYSLHISSAQRGTDFLQFSAGGVFELWHKHGCRCVSAGSCLRYPSQPR